MERHGIDGLTPKKRLQYLASIPEKHPNPILGITDNGEISYANASAKKIFYDKNMQALPLPKKIIKAAKKARLFQKIIHTDITWQGTDYLFSLFYNLDEKQIILYGMDIAKIKNAKLKLNHLIHYDSLTHIPNRQYFELTLNACLNENRIHGDPLCLLLLDLDNFKLVNDTLGHAMGDKLLQSASKRMLNCLRQFDFIARLGGDEFVIILDKTGREGAYACANNINDVLAKPFQISGYRMDISCSIGIAVSPESGLQVGELLKHADIAMYEAKKAGKNTTAIFSGKLHLLQHKRDTSIKKDLKFAAIRSQLYLEYQPQFYLDTHKIFGFEAFLRWKHPLEGLITPHEFIPIAEQNGLIHYLGQWIIEQAMEDYTHWLQPVVEGNLSVNISLPQLNSTHFVDNLCNSLLQHHLNNHQLILDINEHILTNPFSNQLDCLQELSKQGIKLSIDNFGSPTIPFPALIELPLDYIKLDDHLIQNITTKPKKQMLLQGVITLAKKLGLEVIQKGIEHENQDKLLREFGCTYGQGLYYCKPLRLEALLEHLKQKSV